MPLFRKRPESVPDADLPLDVDGAAALRRLVREEFARHGREVVVEADHVRDDAGGVFGLWNLAVLCADQPQRRWPGLVEQHVRQLVSPDHELEDLTEEQLLDLVHLRLQAHDSDDHTVERTVPGVPSVLAVDLPSVVSVPRTSYWEERGGVARWLEVGRRNLAVLVGAPDVEHLRVQEGDTDFHALIGDSFFVASLALVLDDVLRRYDGDADLSRGVLVAVPNRHQLVWRAVDSASVVPTINGIVAFAALGYDDGAGPVSPYLMWRQPTGTWTRLSDHRDGRPVVDVTPEFQDALESLLE